MLSVKIVAVGKMKDSGLAALVDEYRKRLRPFVKLEVVEVAHEPFKDVGDKEKAQKKEAERIRKACGDGVVIALEERGKLYTSPALADYLQKLDERGEVITFVIGGALGLHPELTTRMHSLSLSPLTFTHEMARLILCEQLYRAACIMNGKQYHY